MDLLRAARFHCRLQKRGYSSRLHYEETERQWHVVVTMRLGSSPQEANEPRVDVHFHDLPEDKELRTVKIRGESGKLYEVKVGGAVKHLAASPFSP